MEQTSITGRLTDRGLGTPTAFKIKLNPNFLKSFQENFGTPAQWTKARKKSCKEKELTSTEPWPKPKYSWLRINVVHSRAKQKKKNKKVFFVIILFSVFNAALQPPLFWATLLISAYPSHPTSLTVYGPDMGIQVLKFVKTLFHEI